MTLQAMIKYNLNIFNKYSSTEHHQRVNHYKVLQGTFTYVTYEQMPVINRAIDLLVGC